MFVTPAEILEKDFSQEYATMLRIYGGESYDTSFIQHMMDTVVMSHYKYGWVADKPSDYYKMLAGFEDTGFIKDKNLEHMVNIANYAMFRYIMNGRKGANPEDPRKLIDIGVEAMKRYKAPQEGEKYQGTGSDKSVVKKPQSVTDHLRELLCDTPYEYVSNVDTSARW